MITQTAYRWNISALSEALHLPEPTQDLSCLPWKPVRMLRQPQTGRLVRRGVEKSRSVDPDCLTLQERSRTGQPDRDKEEVK